MTPGTSSRPTPQRTPCCFSARSTTSRSGGTAYRRGRNSAVVRPDGVVIGAAISRLASLIDGLNLGLLADPGFVAIVGEDLHTGQHRNPDQHEKWFTTAYFHHPDELSPEMTEAGLVPELVEPVEVRLKQWVLLSRSG